MLTPEERTSLDLIRAELEALLAPRRPRLILFGSKARNEETPDSDTDVAIIVPGLDRTLRQKIIEIIVRIEVERVTPLSTLILDAEEFERLKRRERRLALDIEREGIPL
ncbi:MAG: hypothetical protein OZSIB_3604 [Candidatus Ozemobacter sibiricus]|jgi:predicted nucleotidyltransferase|uniref:Polymerase nucleotidyl transferase domain-containing protein n=1 Tax=Candidatus Ozemobacter sibiricus TaxID=2268124 RepID=A0A367ZPY7_9BACT|nr:MAG: hypothetical protein OZSIB_3604 [Candidatus Ozemobacter sibiricus]